MPANLEYSAVAIGLEKSVFIPIPKKEVGGVFRMGNTCKSMADSYQCMAKTTTIL